MGTEIYTEDQLSGVGSQVLRVPVELIRPGKAQMRRIFDAEALDNLAESIRSAGLIQPIVVRSVEGGYELVAGERRWRAAQRAGWHEIPAIVRDDVDDEEAVVLGLIENLQRESLTAMETAHGLKELSARLSLTHAAAADRIGKSRVYVTNFLRLLNLCDSVQQQVNVGELSMGHARALATLPPSDQAKWAALSVGRSWSVRTLEAKLRQRGTVPEHHGDDAEWQRLAKKLTELLGNRVELHGDAHGRGQMNIKFHSFEELDGILDRLGYSNDDF
ncbi:MAG: ParB/RepB/Spo0J family partition protein [Oceanococcus sp.]